MESVHFVPDQCAIFDSHFSSVKIFQIDFFNFASHFNCVQIFQIYFSLKNEKFLFPTFHCNFPIVHYLPLCIFKCVLRLPAWVDVKSHSLHLLLFTTVSFHMCLQSTCIRGSKIALIAFVRLFSTVHFQMCLQSACIRGYKVTLVTFV